MAHLKVGIIGRGNVGSALGKGLAGAGYTVRATGKNAAEVAEVGRWADLVILAVPYGERRNAVEELGEGVRDKPLVDATNAVEGNLEYAGSLERSGAEEVQGLARGAKVVKAFNTVFAQTMSTGKVGGERLALFAAGDDQEAKQTVLDLGAAIGFEPVDAGPLEHARWLEPLGYLNIALGYKAHHGPDSGFRYVHGKGGHGASRGVRLQPNAPRERATVTATAM